VNVPLKKIFSPEIFSLEILGREWEIFFPEILGREWEIFLQGNFSPEILMQRVLRSYPGNFGDFTGLCSGNIARICP